jgi:hypothetical protein
MTSQEIKDRLRNSFAFNTSSIYVPEYTHRELRIDAIVINIAKRWIRGFEIKISRTDWLQDDKWVLYSQFCSSLSIVCPEDLIKPNEIEKPFGLLYILEKKKLTSNLESVGMVWKKKPQNFQKRNGLSWFWTYTKVLENETMRLDRELNMHKLREKRNNGRG